MSDYWTPIGHLTDVPRRGSRQVVTSRMNIAIFRTSEDRVFALEDRCPHKGGPLSQGIIHDTGVACPLHNWVIDLDTGRAREPDHGCVRKFPVRVRANVIEICLEPPADVTDDAAPSACETPAVAVR